MTSSLRMYDRFFIHLSLLSERRGQSRHEWASERVWLRAFLYPLTPTVVIFNLHVASGIFSILPALSYSICSAFPPALYLSFPSWALFTLPLYFKHRTERSAPMLQTVTGHHSSSLMLHLVFLPPCLTQSHPCLFCSKLPLASHRGPGVLRGERVPVQHAGRGWEDRWVWVWGKILKSFFFTLSTLLITSDIPSAWTSLIDLSKS